MNNSLWMRYKTNEGVIKMSVMSVTSGLLATVGDGRHKKNIKGIKD